MLQPEFQTDAHQIDYQRPFKIAVTISAHDRDAGSDGAQLIENRFGANIAQMPNLVSIFCHLFHVLGQTIVRVRQHEDAQRFFRFLVRGHVRFRLLTPSREQQNSQYRPQ